VDALVTYMKALGGHVRTGEDHIELIGFPEVLDEISIDPLEDHRLAMAMAMFSATGCNVTIRNAEVVRKSYPLFWEQVLSIGLPLIKT
jgi:5-enolpyruvylshikimate-3-phosphate synthase